MVSQLRGRSQEGRLEQFEHIRRLPDPNNGPAARSTGQLVLPFSNICLIEHVWFEKDPEQFVLLVLNLYLLSPNHLTNS